jgi:hypothetical protein
MSTLPSRANVSALDLRKRFEHVHATYSPSTVQESVELHRPEVDHSSMSDMTREEVKARLEASEARVSTVVETMRSDAAELKSELHTGLEQIKAQGIAAQVNADKFYAQAGTLLAESKTLLAEIRQAGEKNRADVMSMGYKALTWIFGAALALCGLYFTIKKANAPVPSAVVTSLPGSAQTAPQALQQSSGAVPPQVHTAPGPAQPPPPPAKP